MTKNGRERRMMAREMKSGKVYARRFFKASDYFDRKRNGKLEELKQHRLGKNPLGFWVWGVRDPRPSLIHKGGKP